MAEQQDQIVEFLTKLYSQDPLGTLNSVIKALDKCQVDLVSRAQRMFGAVEQGNATTMTNIGIRYHRMAIKVTTALPIIPDNYQQTLNERIVELASPAAMSIPNTSGHLLRANATDELAPAFTRVNNKADTRRFACTFYNSLTAYFQSLVYHSLPQQVAYEIMTAAGFSRTNFMPTVARGDILQQVIQSFGPSALLVSEVFPQGIRRADLNLGEISCDSRLSLLWGAIIVTLLAGSFITRSCGAFIVRLAVYLVSQTGQCGVSIISSLTGSFVAQTRL